VLPSAGAALLLSDLDAEVGEAGPHFAELILKRGDATLSVLPKSLSVGSRRTKTPISCLPSNTTIGKWSQGPSNSVNRSPVPVGELLM
jgi:hypothetical protein